MSKNNLKATEFLKVKAFESDFETTSRIIKKLWDLNDESTKHFSELNMLLSINDIRENIKMKKGLTTVIKNLREMADKLEINLEIKQADIEDEEVI